MLRSFHWWCQTQQNSSGQAIFISVFLFSQNVQEDAQPEEVKLPTAAVAWPQQPTWLSCQVAVLDLAHRDSIHPSPFLASQSLRFSFLRCQGCCYFSTTTKLEIFICTETHPSLPIVCSLTSLYCLCTWLLNHTKKKKKRGDTNNVWHCHVISTQNVDLTHIWNRWI